MIAVQDRQAVSVQEVVSRQRVQCAREELGAPAIEQVTGDGEMVGSAGSDARKLAIQPRNIAIRRQVQIR